MVDRLAYESIISTPSQHRCSTQSDCRHEDAHSREGFSGITTTK